MQTQQTSHSILLDGLNRQTLCGGMGRDSQPARETTTTIIIIIILMIILVTLHVWLAGGPAACLPAERESRVTAKRV